MGIGTGVDNHSFVGMGHIIVDGTIVGSPDIAVHLIVHYILIAHNIIN